MNINDIVYENSRSKGLSGDSIGTRKAVPVKNSEKSSNTVNINKIPASLNHASGIYAKNLKEESGICSDKKDENKDTAEYFEDVISRMTNEDASDIEEEGMTFEKYEAERLDRALTRMKEQKQLKEDAIEGEAEKRETQRENVERSAISNAFDGFVNDQVIQAIQSANLPLTKENAVRIAQALEMSKSVEALTDVAKQFMIGNQLEPTIQNFYQADYSSHSQSVYSSGMTQSSVDENWAKLESQVKDVIINAGMEVTEENMSKCKWLYNNDLPITEDSLQKMNLIEEIKQNYNENDVLDKIIDTFELGKAPEDTSLSFLAGDVKQVTEDFIKEIDNLLKDHDIDIKSVTSRRQLEEVRMKMTMDVSQKLMEKGIKIDTEHIQDVIDGLKQIEDDYYKGLLSEGNVEPTEQNVSVLKSTVQSLYEIAHGPNVVLGQTFENRDEQTITSLRSSAVESSKQFEQANESYETMMTEPRKDLGDSIKKAFAGIDDILKDLGLEVNEANRRAVRILGYNSIEINSDSINEMKNYDSKVQTLLKELTPSVTVEMIKTGMNPLDTPLDELNQELKEIRENLGVSEEEKYSEFLWKLDRNKSLSDSERKAYIGIYRMLHQVEKSDGAAIGSVIKAGQNLTLSNLMTAVRTAKSNGIDKEINDSFGTIEELTFKNETISEQVEYYRRVTSDIMNSITPEALQEFAVTSEVLEGAELEATDISLEKLKEELENVSDNSHKEYLQQKIDDIQQQLQGSEDTISFLEALEVPSTIENIIAYDTVSKKGFWKGVLEDTSKEEIQQIKELSQQTIDGLDTDSGKEIYEELTNRSSDIVNDKLQKDDNSFKDVSLLRLMGSGLCLTGSMAKQESYHLPMIVGDSITDVHVTVLHKGEESGKAEVSFDSDSLGHIKAEFSVKGDEVKGFINTDNKSTLVQLSEVEAKLTEQMDNLGLNLKHIDYGFHQDIKTSIPETGAEGVSTKTLLTVAKTFISTIQSIE